MAQTFTSSAPRIENAFARLKDWRGIVKRYDRCAEMVLAVCDLVAIVMIWSYVLTLGQKTGHAPCHAKGYANFAAEHARRQRVRGGHDRLCEKGIRRQRSSGGIHFSMPA